MTTPLRFLGELGTATAFLLLAPRFRNHAGRLATVLGGFVGCFFLLGTGRVIGGAEPQPILVEYLNTFTLVCALLVTLTVLALSCRPHDVLDTLDWLHVPRSATYVLLSAATLIPQVKNIGARQIALLRLKGLASRSLLARMLAYRRIVGPLFAVLMTAQLTHARSLAGRAFFSARAAGRSPFASPLSCKDDVLMLMLVLASAILWMSIPLR